MKYLNSKEVSNILGINISTLKRWTDNGTIKCKKTPGGHRKFTMQHVREYYKNNKESGKNFGAVLDTVDHKEIYNFIKNNDFDSLTQRLAETSILSDDLSVNTIIRSSYMSGYPVADIFDKIIEPASDIVENWLNSKSISHIEEYISRKLITRGFEALNQDKPNGTYNGKAALCINFEDDLPDLGIAMSEVVLRHCGYNVFNSGSHAELGSLKTIIKKEKIDTLVFYLCDRQCCRATSLNNLKKTGNQVIEIVNTLQTSEILIIFGGEGLKHLDKFPKERVETFNSYKELHSIV